ncbi:helix-turn-helix domain-containing protein [Oxalobacteraceae bacterium]|nr:helix-turn-helix domain-containing protein [Oxalobacteraceae bacterium]
MKQALREAPSAAGATRKIVMFAYDGVELLDVAGPMEAFATASALIGGPVPSYTVQIASERRGMIRTASGLAIESERDLGTVRGIDTLLIAGGGSVVQLCEHAGVVGMLTQQAGRARRIGSVCTGAMLLAATGLLDGRRAVTHWNWCERLARGYPKVRVESAPIFIADGPVWSSGGMTAGIDLALAMIEDDFGVSVALRTARELVMFLRRPGGQSQFGVDTGQPQSSRDEAMRQIQKTIVEQPGADLSVEALARHAAMSPRNFARVFKRETGSPPAEFVERTRLEHVRRQLESTYAPVEAIAIACGFRSADVMRRAFLRYLQVSPTEYRERFSACRASPPAAFSNH